MGLAGGFGAAAGAQSLEEILKQHFLQGLQNAKLKEDQRQADMQNQVQQAQLGQGQQRINQDASQFDVTSGQANQRLGMDKELQPVRIKQMQAQTEDLNRQPQEAIDTRNFTTARDATQHGYQMGEIGAQGANALRVANVRHPDAPAQTPQQENEVNDSLNLIDQIANDPSLNTAVGPVDAYIGKARDLTGVTRFDNLHQQLLGKLSLAQAGKLKGQGQISDKERAMLAAAASALSRNLSETDYKAELGKIRGQFQRMQAAGGATPAAQPKAAPQEFDYVPGKGLVPRGQK